MNTTADLGFMIYDDAEADEREALARLLAEIEEAELGVVIEKIPAS
jgi:hypothetical protein